MRVVAKKILREFWEIHTDTEDQLKTWFKEASKAVWENPTDIKGNKYRLVVDINYLRQWVFIRFIGTHSEYDNIDANTI